jgi:hypothetical protein
MAVNTASDHAEWSFSDNLVYLTIKEKINLNLANKLDNKKQMASFPGFLFLAAEAAKNECTPFSGGEVVQSYL